MDILFCSMHIFFVACIYLLLHVHIFCCIYRDLGLKGFYREKCDFEKIPFEDFYYIITGYKSIRASMFNLIDIIVSDVMKSVHSFSITNP